MKKKDKRSKTMPKGINQYYTNVSAGDNTLWGRHSGQLDFVSLRIEQRQARLPARQASGIWTPYVIIRFTDHDVRVCKDAPVDSIFYELEFPVADI